MDKKALTIPVSNSAYSAGVMILLKEHPQKILYRSPQPVLVPTVPQEPNGEGRF